LLTKRFFVKQSLNFQGEFLQNRHQTFSKANRKTVIMPHSSQENLCNFTIIQKSIQETAKMARTAGVAQLAKRL